MDFTGILKNTGDFVGDFLAKGINFLSLQTPSKIVGIILLLFVAMLIFKAMQKGVKWLIILLIAYLVVSLGYSIFQ